MVAGTLDMKKALVPILGYYLQYKICCLQHDRLSDQDSGSVLLRDGFDENFLIGIVPS